MSGILVADNRKGGFMFMRHITAILAAVILSVPAYAAVNFNFGVEVAPPPPQVEVMPPPRPGFIWAPGYWNWEGGRHVWVGGNWVGERRGYAYVPDRWVEYREGRGSHWHREPGHWERERHHYH
jgi:hypothetical protein